MSAPLDMLYGGRRIIGTTVNGQAIVAKLYPDEEDAPEEEAEWRQPLGLRARPEDKKADALVYQDGDFPEVLTAWCPTLNLGDIAKGVTQLYSVGANPQHVEVADDHIYFGTKPTDFILLGTKYRSAQSTFHSAVNKAITAVPTAAAPTEPLAVAIRKALLDIQTAIVDFEKDADKFLSKLVKSQ